jgi:ketosteroid isomerase-like protein
MQFRARMLEKVNVVITAWQEAWDTDDTESLSDAYSQVGTLLVSGEQLKGRDQIEAHFQEILPSIGHLTFSLAEFESSASMAMLVSNFLFREEVAPNERREVLGQCLTVLVEEHGSWKIRSQVFHTLGSS